MEFAISNAVRKAQLKRMIMRDAKMTDMEKLHEVFVVDAYEVNKKFPELYTAICAVLNHDINPDFETCNKYEIYISGIGVCCEAYDASKCTDEFYPDCREENCPIVHPGLLEGATL